MTPNTPKARLYIRHLAHKQNASCILFGFLSKRATLHSTSRQTFCLQNVWPKRFAFSERNAVQNVWSQITRTAQTFCTNAWPHGGQEELSSLWAWPLAPRRAWWGSEEHPRPEEGLESTLERRSRFWWAGRQAEPPNAAIWMLPRTPIVHRCDQSGFSRNLAARLHPCSHCALARVAL